MKKILIILFLCIAGVTFGQKRNIHFIKTVNGVAAMRGEDSTWIEPPYANRLDFGDALYDQTGILNARDYGALGDGVTDDTEELQDWLDAGKSATAGVGGLYLPAGNYVISDTLVLKGIGWGYSSPMIFGDGQTSIIHNHGTTPAFKFEDVWKPQMKDLRIQGDGGLEGVGSTNGYGLILDYANYGVFDNVFIDRNGGGIYSLNGNYGNKFINCLIRDNLGDGANFVNRGTDLNGGENGNALSFVNCNISFNEGDGIEYASANLNLTGNIIEFNNGSGLQLGSEDATTGVFGVSVVGNYFEANDTSQIKMETYQVADNEIHNVLITGNYFNAGNTIGDVTIIGQVNVGPAFPSSVQNVTITDNQMTHGVYVTTHVSLETDAPDVVVENPLIEAGANVLEYGSSQYLGAVYPQPIYTTIVAANGITTAKLYPVIRFEDSAARDITADPQIVDGLFDGMVITIIGSSDVNTLTLDDGDGLLLSAQFVMGVGDAITLMYVADFDYWVELSRSNN